MECGIIGPPLSGKSILFSLLTGNVESGVGHSQREPQRGIAKLNDDRLAQIAEICRSARTVPACIEYVDVPGAAVAGSGQREPYPIAVLNELRTTDLLVLVLRGFENAQVPHPRGSIDPKRDFATAELEFIVNDLAVIEKRLERLAKQHDPAYRAEAELLERCRQALDDEIPLRNLTFDLDSARILRGFSFLSLKPLLVVLNIGEDDISCSDDRLTELKKNVPNSNRTAVGWIAVATEIEAEIEKLAAEERDAFRSDLGITCPAKEVVIRATFDLLGLITFFTANEKEAAARIIRAGSNALAAAHSIHADIARGFIRAEVCRCEDLFHFGSLHKLKEEGRVHLEGKEYIVQDGDVIYIRFSH